MSSLDDEVGGIFPITPVLRWAGGKRWLTSALRELGRVAPPERFIEPFVGGGAMFFSRPWRRPVIGDLNRALTLCYLGIAQDPDTVKRILKSMKVDRDTYLKVAASRPRTPARCAARLLYLNRTAYSGIYRENANGVFNVPFSGERNTASLIMGDRLDQLSVALKRAQIVTGDFEQTMRHAGPGSLIYCDPPYSLPGAEITFRRYGHSPFNWDDQQRLARKCVQLSEGGCTVIVSNISHELVDDLYRSAETVTLTRRTPLNRGKASEQKESLHIMHADPIVARRVSDVLRSELP